MFFFRILYVVTNRWVYFLHPSWITHKQFPSIPNANISWLHFKGESWILFKQRSTLCCFPSQVEFEHDVWLASKSYAPKSKITCKECCVFGTFPWWLQQILWLPRFRRSFFQPNTSPTSNRYKKQYTYKHHFYDKNSNFV